MNRFDETMSFSEEEKQALALRLQTAARRAKKPARLRVRRLVCVAAAAALLVVGAGAAGAGPFTGLKLYINGQTVEAGAVMTLHADGSATVTVSSPNAEDTHITDPNGALPRMILTGDAHAAEKAQAPIVQQKDGDAAPYALYVQDGRLLLHINGYIPVDVTDRLAQGVPFAYTDENGAQRSAVVSGTAEDYTVQ